MLSSPDKITRLLLVSTYMDLTEYEWTMTKTDDLRNPCPGFKANTTPNREKRTHVKTVFANTIMCPRTS